MPHYVARIPDPFHGTTSEQPAFIIREPNSVKADKEGLHDGDLLLKGVTSEEIAKMKEKKDAIEKKLKGKNVNLEIRFTSFKNWGGTQEMILLYAKPTTPFQAITLVNAVREVNRQKIGRDKIKVSD